MKSIIEEVVGCLMESSGNFKSISGVIHHWKYLIVIFLKAYTVITFLELHEKSSIISFFISIFNRSFECRAYIRSLSLILKICGLKKMQIKVT